MAPTQLGQSVPPVEFSAFLHAVVDSLGTIARKHPDQYLMGEFRQLVVQSLKDQTQEQSLKRGTPDRAILQGVSSRMSEVIREWSVKILLELNLNPGHRKSSNRKGRGSIASTLM